MLAAGLVVGAGAAATLASWNDSEWVFGGASGADVPGIGTSGFEVQQNTTTDLASDSANWVDEESSPGGALTFSAGALALTPGDAVYAPVSLRTAADSLGAVIGLVSAVDGTTGAPGTALWNVLDLRVAAAVLPAASARPACDATAFASSWASGSIGTAAATTEAALQSLQADSADTLHVCFEIELPETAQLLTELGSAAAVDALQGLQVTPVWRFDATSVPS